MTTENNYLVLIPDYLIHPNQPDPFVQLTWSVTGTVQSVNLKPLHKTLMQLRQAVHQHILQPHINNNNSVHKDIAQYAAVHRNTNAEIFVLMQIAQLYLYLYNEELQHKFVNHESKWVKAKPVLAPILKRSVPHQQQLIDQVYRIGQPLGPLIQRQSSVRDYMNRQPLLDTSTSGSFKILNQQPPSFILDLFGAIESTSEIDSLEIVNLLSRRQSVKPHRMLKQLISMVEQQFTNLKGLLCNPTPNIMDQLFPVATSSIDNQDVFTSDNQKRMSYRGMCSALSKIELAD